MRHCLDFFFKVIIVNDYELGVGMVDMYHSTCVAVSFLLCGFLGLKSGTWGQHLFLLSYLALPPSGLNSQAYGGFCHLVKLLSNPNFPPSLPSFFG